MHIDGDRRSEKSSTSSDRKRCIALDFDFQKSIHFTIQTHVPIPILPVNTDRRGGSPQNPQCLTALRWKLRATAMTSWCFPYLVSCRCRPHSNPPPSVILRLNNTKLYATAPAGLSGLKRSVKQTTNQNSLAEASMKRVANSAVFAQCGTGGIPGGASAMTILASLRGPCSVSKRRLPRYSVDAWPCNNEPIEMRSMVKLVSSPAAGLSPLKPGASFGGSECQTFEPFSYTKHERELAYFPIRIMCKEVHDGVWKSRRWNGIKV